LVQEVPWVQGSLEKHQFQAYQVYQPLLDHPPGQVGLLVRVVLEGTADRVVG